MARRWAGQSRHAVSAALALILVSTLALAWVGVRTVTERERGLQFGFSATAVLVRDRIAAELQAETDRAARAFGALPAVGDLAGAQRHLQSLLSDRPWAPDAFVRSGPMVVATSLWSDTREPRPQLPAPAVHEGEIAELRDQDLAQALRHYREALAHAQTPEAKAIAQARLARVQLKAGSLDAGLASYQALSATASAILDRRGVPWRIVAHAEIVDALAAAGRQPEHRAGAITFLREVLDSPWNIEHSYRFYLAMASRAAGDADPALARRAAERQAEIERIAWVQAEGDALGRRSEGLRVPHSSQVLVAWTIPAAEPSASAGLFVRPDDFLRLALPRVTSGLGLDDDVVIAGEDEREGASPLALARADIGPWLPGTAVIVRDRRGRSLAQLTSRERWTYGGLVGGALVVLVAGLLVTMRAWSRETELSRLRTDFVSNVSHELKTPLALIRMFGETLESGLVEDAEKRREFSGIIRRESDRLTHLINNVLDAAKIEAGTRSFSLERGDLVVIVREALDAYAALFKRLGIEVETALPDSAVPVRMDRDAVAQALVNLFQNAIRYAADGRHVAVAVTPGVREVSVSVADRGAGIPEDDLPRIFDKFFRSRATDGGVAGSGLGLSIVKYVMTAHGGRVEATSTPGQGSVFTLVFPTEGTAG